MIDIKEEFSKKVKAALMETAGENAALIENMEFISGNAPDSEKGDLGIPLFQASKALHISPLSLAEKVCSVIDMKEIGSVVASGPYVNLKINREKYISQLFACLSEKGNDFASVGKDGKKHLEGEKIMIEFSSPNTNKPLHLGHLRNDALGESVSRILKKAGGEVYKVDLVNDRGIHICKSMLAYKLFHEKKGETPDSLGMKGDHFVGKCYVEYSNYEKEHPEIAKDAEALLVKWEEKDEEVCRLWEKMREWAFSGIKETYEKTDVSFDKYYFESETYLKGKKIIQDALERGVFFRSADGSVRSDVTPAVGFSREGGKQEKVLLRADGTSVYITQDIGTAVSRREDFPFDSLIYVVASEQNYHFKVLFYLLKLLGYEWAKKLTHLSYGLVNLPNGRMKSREGTVVDADDLLNELKNMALKEIRERGRENEMENAEDVAAKVALSAVHYYLLNVAPAKDMLFKAEESLSFNGNTGPYIQYMCARIVSLSKKARDEGLKSAVTPEKLTGENEWALIKKIGEYPEILRKAASLKDPSLLCSYVYAVAKLFAKFYQDCPIVGELQSDVKKAESRLALSQAALFVLKDAAFLLIIPFLEAM